jgi:DNA polymerase III, alpha subunit
MFAELCCTSNFTFLTGASHPDELVARAHQLGYAGVGGPMKPLSQAVFARTSALRHWGSHVRTARDF